MTPRARICLFGLLIVTGLVAAACGGGPTREEYAEQADEICADAEERFQELETPQDVEDLEAFVDEATQEMDRLIERLRELEPPEEVQEEVGTMLDNLEAAVEEFPGLLEAARSQDLEQIQEINMQIEERVNAANEAAQEIGLERCGSTGPTG